MDAFCTASGSGALERVSTSHLIGSLHIGHKTLQKKKDFKEKLYGLF